MCVCWNYIIFYSFIPIMYTNVCPGCCFVLYVLVPVLYINAGCMCVTVYFCVRVACVWLFMVCSLPFSHRFSIRLFAELQLKL